MLLLVLRGGGNLRFIGILALSLRIPGLAVCPYIVLVCSALPCKILILFRGIKVVLSTF